MPQHESVPTFLGPSNVLRSPSADNERTINLFEEPITPGASQKSPKWGPQTPGLRPFAVFPDKPVRGLFEINDRCFCVIGGNFVELHNNGTFGIPQPIAWGFEAGSNAMVTMASSGRASHQVLAVASALGFVFDLTTGVLVNITSAGFPFPAGQCEFMDGYYLVTKGGRTNQFNVSNLENALLWDPLDVAQRSIAGDNVEFVKRFHKGIWLGGWRTTEIWGDTGDPLFAFAPEPNILLERGSQSGYSVQVVQDTLIWLEQNAGGLSRVVKTAAYDMTVVSPPAVEAAITKRLHYDASAWSYEQEGHAFYVLQIDGAETAFVYDLSLDRWHERASWDPKRGIWTMYRPWNHVLVFDKHLVGDSQTGAIYEMSTAFETEELVTP